VGRAFAVAGRVCRPPFDFCLSGLMVSGSPAIADIDDISLA